MERGCSNVRIDGIAQLGAIRRSKFHNSFYIRYALFSVGNVGKYIVLGIRVLADWVLASESHWLSFVLA